MAPLGSLFGSFEKISIEVDVECTVAVLKLLLQSHINTSASILRYEVWLKGVQSLESSDTFAEDFVYGAEVVLVTVKIYRGRKLINIVNITSVDKEQGGGGEGPTQLDLGASSVSLLPPPPLQRAPSQLRSTPFQPQQPRPLPQLRPIVMRSAPQRSLLKPLEQRLFQQSQPQQHQPQANRAGQVELWAFLLGLLNNYDYIHVIQWINPNGEFRFINPDEVALLWGDLIGISNMSFAQLLDDLNNDSELNEVNGVTNTYRFVNITMYDKTPSKPPSPQSPCPKQFCWDSDSD